eukprot:6198801-Pleurochrysis_carterae.AAC.2
MATLTSEQANQMFSPPTTPLSNFYARRGGGRTDGRLGRTRGETATAAGEPPLLGPRRRTEGHGHRRPPGHGAQRNLAREGRLASQES